MVRSQQWHQMNSRVLIDSQVLQSDWRRFAGGLRRKLLRSSATEGTKMYARPQHANRLAAGGCWQGVLLLPPQTADAAWLVVSAAQWFMPLWVL